MGKMKEVSDREENEIVRLEVGDVQDSILTKKDVSKKGTNMYFFKDGELLFGSSILDKKMSKVKVGEHVRITRLEDGISKTTGNTFHNFKVEHDVDEPSALEGCINYDGEVCILNHDTKNCIKDGNVCPDFRSQEDITGTGIADEKDAPELPDSGEQDNDPNL